MAAVVEPRERLRTILEQKQTVPARELADLVQTHATPEQVGDENGLRLRAKRPLQ